MKIWTKENGKTHALSNSFVTLCGHTVPAHMVHDGDEAQVTCFNCQAVLVREEAKRSMTIEAERSEALRVQTEREKVRDRWFWVLAAAAVGALLLYQAGAFSNRAPSGVDLDCDNFGTVEAAQAELNRSTNDGFGDRYGLDADGDGGACELLPSSARWGTAGALLTGFGVLLGAPPVVTKRRISGDDVMRAVVGSSVLGTASFFVTIALPSRLPRETPAVVYLAIGALLAAVLALLYLERSRSLTKSPTT